MSLNFSIQDGTVNSGKKTVWFNYGKAFSLAEAFRDLPYDIRKWHCPTGTCVPSRQHVWTADHAMFPQPIVATIGGEWVTKGEK